MTDQPEQHPADALWARWGEVDALFDRLLELPVGRRAEALEEATSDPVLREAVRRLLAAAGDTGEFAAVVAVEVSAGGLEAGHIPEDLAGERIGPFAVVRLLGRGGMGSVYLARRAEGDFAQEVALKVLRRGIDTEDVLARFRAERRILAGLHHPNIATLIDGGATEDGRPWLAMEYVEGDPIAVSCAAKGMAVRDRVDLVRLVALAVQEAHRNLIVHRDIKPANVLVTPVGMPKLLDFGIAKLLDADHESPATGTGRQPYTPRYAAPEQRRGDRATTATDVYQLGLLLHETITGSLPTPDNPSGALSGDLALIAARACHEEPARRYQAAGAFAEELERWLAGRPIMARPDRWGYRTLMFLRRHRWVAPAVAATLLLGGGWITTVVRQNAALSRARAMAEAEAERASEVLDFVLTLFRAADPVIIPPGGSWRDLTVVDAMRLGVPRIREQFADRPVLQAELLGTIAEVLWGLEVQEGPLELARESERLLARALGDTAPARVLAMGRLARLQSSVDREATEHLVDSVLALHRTAPAVHREAAVDALSARGRTRRRAGDFAGAAASYAEADALIAGDPAFDAEATLLVVNGRLNTYVELDSLDAAMREARRAMAIAEARLPDRALSRAIAKVNVARLLTGHGDANAAVALYEDALPVIVESYGPRHTTALSTRNNYAMALREVGRLPEAITILQQALADRRALVTGVADAGVADMQQNIGVYLLEAGDTAEALTALRAAAANYAASLPGSPLRVFPNLTLSAVALAQADWVVAEREARTALAALEAGLPPAHFAIEVARCRVGRALLGRGRSSDAAPYLRLAGERLVKREATTPYRGECVAAWALLERRRGNVPRADSVLAAME